MEDQKGSKAAKKKDKQEEEKRADALLKVVLEDKAVASQEAKLNQRNNNPEEVFRSLRKIIQKSIGECRVCLVQPSWWSSSDSSDWTSLPKRTKLTIPIVFAKRLTSINHRRADQDDLPPEARDSIASDLAASAKPSKEEHLGDDIASGVTSGLESAFEEIKQTGQSIKDTIAEETKQELEAVKDCVGDVESSMDQLKEKFVSLIKIWTHRLSEIPELRLTYKPFFSLSFFLLIWC